MTRFKPTNGIKWHRLRLNLTQAELGKLIGITSAHITEWERWQKTPTPERQAQLAEVLGCEVHELLEEIAPRLELEVDAMKIPRGPKRRPKR